MASDLSVLLSSLLGLFSLIGVGFAVVRLGFLPRSASAPLSALLMKVTLPATLFTSMLRPLDPGFFRSAVTIISLCLVFLVLMVLLAVPLRRLFRVPDDRQGMWQFCSVFSNNGFMGYPIVFALFGEDGLALAAVSSIAYALAMFSIGTRLVCADSVAPHRVPPLSLKNILFTFINFSIALGMVFYAFQIPVPPVILTPLQHLANVTTPISMIVTGMNLAAGPLGSVFHDREAITVSLVRLVLFPLLLFAIFLVLPVPRLIANVILISMAMPTAANATILGEQYGGQKEFAARTVSLSSLLCIFSLPLISLLL